jgi:hypothetical protein
MANGKWQMANGEWRIVNIGAVTKSAKIGVNLRPFASVTEG